MRVKIAVFLVVLMAALVGLRWFDVLTTVAYCHTQRLPQYPDHVQSADDVRAFMDAEVATTGKYSPEFPTVVVRHKRWAWLPGPVFRRLDRDGVRLIPVVNEGRLECGCALSSLTN